MIALWPLAMTKALDDWVVFNMLDHHRILSGNFSECFRKISLYIAQILSFEKCVKHMTEGSSIANGYIGLRMAIHFCGRK